MSLLIKAEGGLTFTELAGGEDKAVAVIDTWEDWDLSAIIGAGSKVVLLEIENWNTTTDLMSGARKKGSALVRIDNERRSSHRVLPTECDADRVIQIYAESDTAIVFCVAGYWS